MISHREAVLFGDRELSLFDDLVEKLFDPPAMHANDMVMVQPALQLEHSLPALEVMPCDQSGRLELGQGAVYGGEPYLFTGLLKLPVDGLGCQVPALHVFQQLEHLESWQGGLQTRILEVFWLVHKDTFRSDGNHHARKLLQMQMRTIIIRKNNPDTVMKHLLFITLIFPLTALAESDAGQPAEYKLVINNHRFQPTEITIPPGTKIRLIVENQDATPEEFDSHPLNREKVIAGHGTATIYIGPLAPGRYPFAGEFNSATAQGVIIAQ